MLCLHEEDANSKYFHAIMSGRRRRNSTTSILVDGAHVKGVLTIREVVFNHFENHMRFLAIHRPKVDNLQFCMLSYVEGVSLTISFCLYEIKVAFWDCE